MAQPRYGQPRYGWYGDDFTGATDTLATLAEAGLRAMLFLRVPTAEQLAAAGELDVVGVAGAARAMAPDAMRAELAPVGRFFAELGVPVLHYKCCSTFDSAPHVGNIAVAVETLRPHFANPLLPIIGGQPNLGRYCTFSTLFASAGAGGNVERIDRHPTMMRHPVTPMGEGDLRRHLSQQGLSPITGIHYPAYAGDLGPAIEKALGAGAAAVLFDVARTEDLPLIGAELARRAEHTPLLCVGASSVAQAWRPVLQGGAPAAASKPLAAAEGPVLVLAGSLSPVTAGQIEAARSSFDILPADGAALVSDSAYRDGLIAQVIGQLQQGRHTLLVTAPKEANDFDPGLSRNVAVVSAELLRTILDRRPLRRVGIAGGDTSSRAVQALDAWGLAHVGILAPGVAICRLRSQSTAVDGVEIMLKGGQMGPADVFRLLLG